jgi:ABC-2 type transport system ATP-binding protein
MTNEYAIEVHGLKKSFGSQPAVQDVTFAARAGEVLSLLGPNGAGKSTTIAMLAGLLVPDAGDACLDGHSIRQEPEAAKAALGVVPQDIALYGDLSARENLVFWGKMYGLSGKALQQRVDEILDIIGLSDRQKDRVSKFSGGMKRRVNIAVALLHKPAVVIMDEPTVGIDPQSRRHILDNVKTLNQAGMTVLYTTHYMEEAAELSHHIAVMDHGRLIACGTHAELIQMVGEQARIDLTLGAAPEQIVGAWQAIAGVTRIDVAERRLSLLVDDSNRVLPRLFDSAAQAGVRITSLAIHEPNLESVFLHLTGRALRD